MSFPSLLTFDNANRVLKHSIWLSFKVLCWHSFRSSSEIKIDDRITQLAGQAMVRLISMACWRLFWNMLSCLGARTSPTTIGVCNVFETLLQMVFVHAVVVESRPLLVTDRLIRAPAQEKSSIRRSFTEKQIVSAKSDHYIFGLMRFFWSWRAKK